MAAFIQKVIRRPAPAVAKPPDPEPPPAPAPRPVAATLARIVRRK